MSIRSPLAERLLGQEEPSLLWTPDAASLAAADEALELADAYPGRGPLDPHQRLAVRAILGMNADGTWAAPTAAFFGPRQSTGKTGVLQIVEQYKVTQLHDRISHTAHEVPTAKDSHLRMVEWLESYDDLRRLVKRVTYANGDQAVEFKAGGVIQYKTRTKGGQRGLDYIGTLIVDEAQEAKPEQLAATSPTLAIHPNPQVIFAGSGGFATSDLAWGMRLEALAGSNPRLAYVEHTAQRVWLENGQPKAVDPDPEDRAMWALANPSLGRRWRQGEQFLADQWSRLKVDPLKFAQEHLCVWELPASADGPPAKLDPAHWQASGTSSPPHVEPGELAMAFAVHDGYTSIAIAAGTLAKAYVEVIDHRPGTGWVPARLVELQQRWRPTVIGLDGGNGPAQAVLSEVLEAFAEHDIPADTVKPMTSGVYLAACEAMSQAVADGKVSRPVVEDDVLTAAASVAGARTLGTDRWLWDLRSSKAPLSPLVAATVARGLLTEQGAQVAEFFVY